MGFNVQMASALIQIGGAIMIMIVMINLMKKVAVSNFCFT